MENDVIKLSGIEKAAVLFLCLPEASGAALMRQLDAEEIQTLTREVATLGSISASTVETVIRDFTNAMAGLGGVIGSYESAERILLTFLPAEKVAEIMADIRGPGMDGSNVWDTVNAMNPQVIMNYMKGEHDQTIATIMTRLRPDVAAQTLPMFGETRMVDITLRMMEMGVISRHTIETVEDTLRREFLPGANWRSGPDPHQRIADMFNKMDGPVFDELQQALTERAPQTFEIIKQKMFTFDDLQRLDPQSLQRIIRGADNQSLLLALRGARKDLREHFLKSMSMRNREMVQNELQAMGPVRAKDVRQAQAEIIDIATDLARQDIIQLPTEADEMI